MSEIVNELICEGVVDIRRVALDLGYTESSLLGISIKSEIGTQLFAKFIDLWHSQGKLLGAPKNKVDDSYDIFKPRAAVYVLASGVFLD